MNAFVSCKLQRFASKLFSHLFTFVISVGFISGCAGGMQMQNPVPMGNTQVVVLLTEHGKRSIG
jgi:hypothetical protein